MVTWEVEKASLKREDVENRLMAKLMPYLEFHDKKGPLQTLHSMDSLPSQVIKSLLSITNRT